VGRNGPFLCAEEGVDFNIQNDPISRLIRHHPVSAQANQCTSFASGLRPHPWRGGNTNGGHLERTLAHRALADLEGIWNAVVGRNGPFLCVCVQKKKGLISIYISQ
jgi:hypothetical protein